MWWRLVLMVLALAMISFMGVSLLSVNEAHAVKASPPTCRYGGKSCRVCEEFEIMPGGNKRCVKCGLDKTKTECIIRFF